MALKLYKEELRILEKPKTIWVLAKKENAVETYAKLKEKYISLKALLNSLGVNMTDIDKIKE